MPPEITIFDVRILCFLAGGLLLQASCIKQLTFIHKTEKLKFFKNNSCNLYKYMLLYLGSLKDRVRQ